MEFDFAQIDRALKKVVEEVGSKIANKSNRSKVEINLIGNCHMRDLSQPIRATLGLVHGNHLLSEKGSENYQ